MRVAWQYRLSLTEQKTGMFAKMSRAMDIYHDLRVKSGSKKTLDSISWTNSNIDYHQHLSMLSAVVTLTFHDCSVRRILGLPDSAVVTDMLKQLASQKLKETESDRSDCFIKKFKVDSVSQKRNIWEAADEVILNHNNPFTVAGIDSVMRKMDLDAESRLITLDTLMWKPEHHLSELFPNPSSVLYSPTAPWKRKP